MNDASFKRIQSFDITNTANNIDHLIRDTYKRTSVAREKLVPRQVTLDALAEAYKWATVVA